MDERYMSDDDEFIREDHVEDYADSFWSPDWGQRQEQISRTSNKAEDHPDDVYDFLTLITAISRTYSCGQYLPMVALNNFEWTDLPGGEGADFVVSTLPVRVQPESLISPAQSTALKGNVVLKKLKSYRSGVSMTAEQIKLFIRELTVLHHFRNRGNIIQLSGIGWLYDHSEGGVFTPGPKPAFLIEKAEGTLEWLLSGRRSLLFNDKMRICLDVASGLLALHKCGLVHGDVKPQNVLVTDSRTYKCKISDFGFTRANNKDDWFRGGTKLYVAPETGMLTPEGFKKTDIWSLGILFSRVTEPPALEKVLASCKANISRREKMIMDSVESSSDNSVWEQPMREILLCLYVNTVRINPMDRDLHRVVLGIREYLLEHDHRTLLEPEPTYSSPFQPVWLPDLYISYENLRFVAGQVHDTIWSSLVDISRQHSSQDPRQKQVLYELAVAGISGYIDPNHSVHNGLAMLHRSASLGHVGAQGVFYRVRKALVPNGEETPEAINWLVKAASSGHQIARQDLRELDPHLSAEAHVAWLDNRLKFITKNISESDLDDETIQTTILVHQIGLSKQHGSRQMEDASINLQDLEGNTPLIIAAKYTNMDMVFSLLKQGAEATRTNKYGENLFHFAGNFASSELSGIIGMVKGRGINVASLLTQEARGTKMDHDLDFYPIPAGIPLERAIAMNNVGVVTVLLIELQGIIAMDGRSMRRSLLLAFRLHLVDISGLLIDFINNNSSMMATSNRTPLSQTTWERKNRKRTLLDAVAVGSVSGYGLGPDVPLNWWRLCCLGEMQETVLIQMYELCLMLEPRRHRMERKVDRAIALTVKEGYNDSLRGLLQWKAKNTDGLRKRVASLRHLTWQGDTACHIFPDDIYLSHSQDNKDHSQERLVGVYRIDRDNSNETLDTWQFLPSRNDQGLLEMPEEVVNYVDQIFDDAIWGTLLHQSIRAGNRAMFKMLIEEFGANLRLPVREANPRLSRRHRGPDSPETSDTISTYRQLNVYSILSKTPHCDIWFAERFRELHVSLSHPVERWWIRSSVVPPLYHALLLKRWKYVKWLLENGARLDEPVGTFQSLLAKLLESQRRDSRWGSPGESTWERGLFGVPMSEIPDNNLELHATQLQTQVGRLFSMIPNIHELNWLSESSKAYHGFNAFKLLHGDWAVQTKPIMEYSSTETIHNEATNPPTNRILARFWRMYKSVGHAIRSDNSDLPPTVGEQSVPLLEPVSAEALWTILFQCFKNTPNSPVKWKRTEFHFSFPVLESGGSWIPYFSDHPYCLKVLIPYKEPSIIQQSLDFGDYRLKRMTLNHFERRAKDSPDHDPLRSTWWLDVLFGSPLHNGKWGESTSKILREHGYFPDFHRCVKKIGSIWASAGILGVLLVLVQILFAKLNSSELYGYYSLTGFYAWLVTWPVFAMVFFFQRMFDVRLSRRTLRWALGWQLVSGIVVFFLFPYELR